MISMAMIPTERVADGALEIIMMPDQWFYWVFFPIAALVAIYFVVDFIRSFSDPDCN